MRKKICQTFLVTSSGIILKSLLEVHQAHLTHAQLGMGDWKLSTAPSRVSSLRAAFFIVLRGGWGRGASDRDQRGAIFL